MSAASSSKWVFQQPTRKRRYDQRLHQRFPINLEIDYKVLSGARVEYQGSGRTVNISSGGVLMETDNLFPPAAGTIELAIRWPFRLEGICPLKLVMRGRIVRRVGTFVAVESDNYEFHTARARSRSTVSATA